MHWGSSLFVGSWLLVGIAFLGVRVFSSISEHNQTKEYKKVIAISKDYTNYTYYDDSELCKAIYEYQVNGITYSVSSSSLSNHGGFNESDLVYYNPNNLGESVMLEYINNFMIYNC